MLIFNYCANYFSRTLAESIADQDKGVLSLCKIERGD
jgi:hypothetical protein